MLTWLVRGLLAALLAGLGAWLVLQTEWVDVEVDVPARGEAARNDFYAAEQVLRALGATTTQRTGMEEMPPAQAVLVLASYNQVLAHDWSERLRRWVEQGGHLVLPGTAASRGQWPDWLPVQASEVTAKNRASKHCRALTARGEDAGPGLPSGSLAAVCTMVPGERYAHRAPGRPPSWALDGPDGPELLRAPHGRGSVTVVGPWALLFNRQVLAHDHALVVAQALQAQAGAQVWFFREASRPPLLLWIWQQAWVAVLLALAALAAAVWRASVRFGPLQAPVPVQRRSMAEQVRGTAHFLDRHGRAALLRAQRRALEETAATQVPQHAALAPAQRAPAIAQAAGLDAAALHHALHAAAAGTPAQLELLETARRRLRRAARRQSLF